MIEKLKRLLAIQKKRYEKKGQKNTVIGLLLLLGIIWSSLALGRYYWPQKIENKVSFIFFGRFFCHEASLLTAFLLYLPGYMGWSNFYANKQINTKSAKLWQRKNWHQVLVKTIKNLMLTQLLVLPVAIYLSNIAGIRVRFDDFPSFMQLVVQASFVFLIDDFLSFWGHWNSHSDPRLYKIHKVHHQFDTLFTWATEYSHPVEYISANMLPAVMGFVILGSKAHCFTFFFWVSWKILMITEGHSGYEFKWSPLRVMPFVADPSYHDYHHSHNVGNFAANCYVWDVLFDTNVEYMDSYLKN